MAAYDSLVISNLIELMMPDNPQGSPSTDPRCTGAVFILDRGYDLGEPQPVSSIVGSLSVDGERPIGRRASNRTLTLPITITAPDRATLVSAREVLFGAIDQQSFTITWVRAGASPAIIDCFRAQPSKIEYDLVSEQACALYLTLTIPALPYLRSSDPQPLAFAGAQAGRSAAPPSTILLEGYNFPSGTYWSAAQAGTPTGSAARWTNPNVDSIPLSAPRRLCSLAFTGTSGNTGGTSFPTITGDGIIVILQTTAAASTFTVSDGTSNSYSQIATSPIPGGGALYIYASFNSAPLPAGRNITVTTSPSNTVLVEVDYWRGVTGVASSPVTDSETNSSPSIGPVTLTASPSMQMVIFANNNSADLSVAPSSAWSLASFNFAGVQRSRAYYTASSTGYVASASYASSQSWAAIAIAFKFSLASQFTQAVNAVYTTIFGTVQNIKGMTSLTHWIGTASVPVPVPVSAPYTPVTPYPRARDLGDLHIHYTLTDSVGRTIQIGSAWHNEPGTKTTTPTWTLVTTRLPQTGIGSFDYGHVVSIRSTITNYAYSATKIVDVFLDDLRAAPSSIPRTTAGSRGRADTMSGVLGTARTPINLVAANTYTPIGVGPVYPAGYSDGFLNIPCDASYDAYAQSGSILNMNGSSVFASIAQVPTGNGSTEAKFQARYDASNYIGFLSTGSKTLTCQLNQAGVLTTHPTSFLSTQYSYWRIREGAPTGQPGLVQIGWVNFAGTIGNIGPKLPGAPSGQPQGPFYSGTTDGDVILLLVLTQGAGVVTVTDTNGSTYTQVGFGNTGDGQTQYWFAAPSAMAINTLTDNITVHSTISQNFSVSAFTAAGFFDVDVHNSNFSATQTTNPNTTTGAMGVSGELEVVSFMSGFHPYEDTTGSPSGWTRCTRVYNFAYSLTSTVYWKKATAQTSDAVTSAFASPCYWSAFILTLKPRLNSGTVYWDVSNDGVSWTNIFSNAHTLGTKLQFMRAYFNAGYSGSEANPPPFLVCGVGAI